MINKCNQLNKELLIAKSKYRIIRYSLKNNVRNTELKGKILRKKFQI